MRYSYSTDKDNAPQKRLVFGTLLVFDIVFTSFIKHHSRLTLNRQSNTQKLILIDAESFDENGLIQEVSADICSRKWL